MYGVQKSSKIGGGGGGGGGPTSSAQHQPFHSNKLSLNSNTGLFDSSCVKLATPTYAGMSSSTIYESGISTKNNTRPSSVSNEK